MKRIIGATVLVLAGIFVFLGVKNHWFQTYEFEINRDFTQDRMEELISGLNDKGVNLQLKNTVYNEAGQLVQIAGSASFTSGNSVYFSGADLDRVIIEKGFFDACGVQVRNLK